MDSGFYAACTALMARTQALDVLANNLANVGTNGYRAQHQLFRSALQQASGNELSPLNQALNDYGVLGGSNIDLSQAGLESTGNPLDLALDGPGFFVVQNANGRFLTRNGGFQVSRQGQLITQDGAAVLGENGPIRVVGGKVSVSDDGTVSVGGAVVGRLKVVSLRPGAALQGVGGTYYTAPPQDEVAAPFSRVRQGMIEGSNVNAIASAVELVTIQRQADLMQRALSMFNSEMNRTAAQDLARVGS